MRLGVTVWFMGKYFPSFRHLIADKRRRVASETTKRRREKLFQDTCNIAAELQRRGEYPSVNRIREKLPEGSCTEWKTLTLATHAARQARSDTNPHFSPGNKSERFHQLSRLCKMIEPLRIR